MANDSRAESEELYGDPGSYAPKDLFPDEPTQLEYSSFKELFEKCKPLISPSVKYEPQTKSNKKRVVRITARRI